MAVTTTYADTSDTYLISVASSATSALNGSSPGVADPSEPDMLIGRSKYGSSSYFAWEAFQAYSVSSPAAGLRVAAAHARLVYFGPDDTIEIRDYDWGASIGSSDWRTPTQLAALDLLASGSSLPVWHHGGTFGSDAFLTKAAAAGTIKVINCTTDQRNAVAPTGDEYVGLDSANVSGTNTDPAIIYSTVPESTLDRVCGAQVQLSDGTWAVLDSDGDASTPTITLAHVSLAGSATTIAALATGATSTTFGYPDGLQGYALAVDADDNLYVLARSGAASNSLAVQAFTYSGGTWTSGTLRTAAMPTSSGTISQVAAAWHDIGTSGTLLALVGHGYADPGSGVDVAYALISCEYLLTGSGSMLRASGDASAVGLAAPSQRYTTLDGAGTLLDVAAQSSTRGYVVSTYLSSGYPPGALGTTCYAWAARYIPGSGGTSVTVDGSARSAPRVYVDAEAKARILPIDNTRMIIVTARPSYGIAVEDLQNIGSSSTFTQVGITYLDGETASMPSAAALASSSLWDVIYDETANAIYLYYFDTADNRRLIRTTIDLSTHLAAGDEEEIDASVGAAGSTNHMLRVARGDRTADATLISVANETSGGTLSTIYVVDASNLPPTAPTLTAKSNYDATASATFYWTFNDPNAGDTQSAFQLQVNSASGASAYDTGKTASTDEFVIVPGSTLTNPGNWQWRVLTYDALDTEGEWSTYGTFSTGASGIVNITVPAADNPDLTASDYTVEWSVSGVTQDHYRVKVVSTLDGSTLSDTGYVAGTDTSYEVTGMSSDIQYQVQVTAQASGVDTNTDTVYLTPDYGSPETPSITITEFDDGGYILVSVVNPSPTGDRPEVAYNDILRRVNGSEGSYTVVGTALTNGTLADYTAASGVEYEYVARAQT